MESWRSGFGPTLFLYQASIEQEVTSSTAECTGNRTDLLQETEVRRGHPHLLYKKVLKVASSRKCTK